MTATCKVCAAPFEFELRGNRPVTCSVECKRGWRRQRERREPREIPCLHCARPFVQVTRRGSAFQTCSDECRAARKSHLRQTVRRERYRTLVAAGAYQAVASDGSQGYRSFRETLAMLREHPELRRPERLTRRAA